MHKSRRQLYLEKELRKEKTKSINKKINENNSSTIKVANFLGKN